MLVTFSLIALWRGFKRYVESGVPYTKASPGGPCRSLPPSGAALSVDSCSRKRCFRHPEVLMSVGFRIFTQRPLPDPELVLAYGAFATAPVADAMHRMCAMTPDVRLLSDPVGTMSGVALTVKARPGDSLMIHKALNMAEEGDVLIVSGGESGRSLMGELMFRYAASKKLAGIVVDGPIRDADCLRGFPLPVYASGFTPGGPYREGPGEINVPVVCCGQSVEPGDIILGDRDGVIVIPSGDAASLYDAARQSHERDLAKTENARRGLFDRGWVDGALERKGCEIVEGPWR